MFCCLDAAVFNKRSGEPMAKTLSSFFSEILVNNICELDSYTCKGEKDTQNVTLGETPETILKLYSQADRPICYSG